MGDYAIEWSDKQKCFHIAPIKEIAEINMDMILCGRTPEYIVVELCNTREEAHEIINTLRNKSDIFNDGIHPWY